MNFSNTKNIKKAERTIRVVNGLLFSLFALLYLAVFQRYTLLTVLNDFFSLSAHWSVPWVLAGVIVALAWLIRWLFSRAYYFTDYWEAISYFPSFLFISVVAVTVDSLLPQTGFPFVSISCTVLLFAIYCGILYLMRKFFPHAVVIDQPLAPMMCINMLILICSIWIVVCLGNTDSQQRKELKMEWNKSLKNIS